METRKAYQLGGELENNRLRGKAAVIGNVDRQGDVILPGAFANALPDFLRAGFVADTHDWRMGQIVAMPVAAQEQGRALVVEAEFHSDPGSQSVRQKIAERLAAGLQIGLSVGFGLDEGGATQYRNGKELLRAAEKSGVDMDLLDVDDIAAHDAPIRAISRIAELYEFSIVPVPANPEAVVTAVKADDGHLPTTEREFERFLREAGFSRAVAKAIASHGFRAAYQREAGDGEADNDTKELEQARIELAKLRAKCIAGGIIL